MAFTVTARHSGTSGATAVQTQATNSVTPTASSLLLAFAGVERDLHTTVESWAFSGGGSWTSVAAAPSSQWNGTADFNVTAILQRLDVGASPSAHTITADAWSGGVQDGYYSVIACDITGHNTSSPIIQSKVGGATEGGGDAESLAVTFDNALTNGSLVVVCFAAGNDVAGAFTAPTIGGQAMTQLHNLTGHFCHAGMWYRVITGAESNRTVTCSDLGQSVGASAAVLVEIAAAGAGTTPIGKDLGLVWNTRAAVGDDLQALWNTRAVVGDNVQLLWNVRQAVGDNLQLLWDVQSPLTAVGKDLSLLWNTRAAAGDDLSLVWNTRSVVGDTFQALWNIRAITSDTLDLRWDARAVTPATLALQWSVRQIVNDVLSLLWNTRVIAGDQLQLLWHTRAAIGDNLELLWDVDAIGMTAVGKSLDLRWNTRAAVGDSLQLAWHTRSPLPADLQLLWHTRAIISDVIDLRWGIRTTVGRTAEFLWVIRSVAGRSIVLLWNVEGVAYQSITDPVSVLLPNPAIATIRNAATAVVQPNQAEAKPQ